MELTIPEDVTGLEIDRAVKAELRTLSKDNAKGVGQHLIMVARLLDEDIDLARAHADAAVRRAGRVPSVREARGMVAYHEGDWHLALQEFRTARRLSGSQHLLPYMIDCERALGRTEKALELATSPEVDTLPAAERIEVAIVTSGIRRDLGQPEAALTELEGRHLVPGRPEPWAPRLYYAYADALLELGRTDDARRWFQAAAEVDVDLQTDAWERLDELDGTVLVDLMDDVDEEEDDEETDALTGAERDAAEARGSSDTSDTAHTADASPSAAGGRGREDETVRVAADEDALRSGTGDSDADAGSPGPGVGAPHAEETAADAAPGAGAEDTTHEVPTTVEETPTTDDASHAPVGDAVTHAEDAEDADVDAGPAVVSEADEDTSGTGERTR